MAQKRIVALVPMRHISERIPGKNYRDFAGKPLFHHIIGALIDCRKFSHILIDTDSETIKTSIITHYADKNVIVVERPQHLRDGTTPMNDVLLHDIQQIEADFYLQTHSTNPLLKPETLIKAIDLFMEKYPIYDSLFGVTRLQTRLWDQLTQPVNHNPHILLRTQDLPPIYEENSTMYIFTRELLEHKHNRIGDRPLMFEVDALEAWDIDEELDFRVAEFLYLQREQEGK